MGNSHSQQHQFLTPQWTHSYPRPRHGQAQVKVLPERIPPLQLKTTDNGAILQNGGTISCRKQSVAQEERVYRPRSSSAHRRPNLEDVTLEKSRFGSEPDLRFHLKEHRDQFGENAVRQRISRSRKKYKAPPAPQNGASSGVESSSPDLNGWEGTPKDCPGRRARLFKTRAETTKKNMTTLKKQEAGSFEVSRSTEGLNVPKAKPKEESFQLSTNGGRTEKKGLKRSASHEVISTRKGLATPEFQAELLEAAQRLRPSSGAHRSTPAAGKTPCSKADPKTQCKEPLSTLNIEIPKDGDFKQNKKSLQAYEVDETGSKRQRSEKSGRANPVADMKREKCERDVPSKKFYFGMKENEEEVKIVNNCASTNNVDKTNAEHRITAVEKNKNLMNLYKSVAEGSQEWEDSVDKFAANFRKSQTLMPNGNTTSCSSSFISDPDEDVDGGIALQLRPTLPKKQLEIPRFSPTAAWRLLSSVETFCSQAPSPGGSDESPLLLEDRIRPPVPAPGLRGNHDKSGDSGISGDASPGGCHESSSEIAAASPPKAMATQNPKNILMAWTPQQDLEEESSSDDLESPLNSSKNAVSIIPGAKFSPRGQLFLSRDQSFSKSTPREERMSLYIEGGDFKERHNIDTTPRLNSLKKLKVALGTSKRNETSDEHHSQNDNWVLSRSVPSSLNNSHIAITRTISNPPSPEQEEECCQQTSLKCPSYSYLASGGRMMYLPEYHSRMSPDVVGRKPRGNMCSGFLSKSCENITQQEMQQVGRSRTPSPVTGRGTDDANLQPDGSRPAQKKKKFTFQSTVRLLENRRLAERLSREAELKENQRLSEVEAMKRVEEEFQKKRAREKANIRQQLRLFSLEEKNYSSLPPVYWEDSRGESFGAAPSSLPPASVQTPQSNAPRKPSVGKKASTAVDVNKFAPTTQVLSEYREPTRDYRDYRQSRLHEVQEFIVEQNRRSVVEHPRVVYDMPKNTAVYVSAPGNTSGQNPYKEETRIGISIPPRSSSSDNYRKDFAHGSLPAGGRSLTSSDSELSQSHPRTSSRQRMASRFGALHRSRSSSPESLTPSSSPSRGIEPYLRLPRSRSASPLKVVTSEKSRSISPKKLGAGACESSDSPSLDPTAAIKKSLQRKLSNPNEYHSHSRSHHPIGGDGNIRTPENMRKNAADMGILRFGLPSLQPFNKAEKSFRPVNFNPVINKVAQPVT